MENIIQEDNFSLPPVQSEEDSLKDMECQTNISCADIDMLQVIYQSMQQEIKALKRKCDSANYSTQAFFDSDEKVV